MFMVFQHLDKCFDAGLHRAVKWTGAVAVQGKNRQPDMPSDDLVVDVPVTETLDVVNEPCDVPLFNFLLNILKP